MGRTIIGFIADRFGPVNSLLLVTFLSGLSQMVVWTFVTTYGGIVRSRDLSIHSSLSMLWLDIN